MIFCLSISIHTFSKTNDLEHFYARNASSILLTNKDNSQIKKNPYLSCMLSTFIPGTGQIYNGDYTKGAVMLTFETIGVYTIIYGVDNAYSDRGKTFVLGLAIIACNTIWSVIDAPIRSNKINLNNGLSYEINSNLILNMQPYLASYPKANFLMPEIKYGLIFKFSPLAKRSM